MVEEKNIIINRKVWQPLWMYYLGEPYDLGYCESMNTDTFECEPYSWDSIGEQDFNFWHKPSGYKITWYKYAMRGAEANMDITAEQFVDILNDCVNEMNRKNGKNIRYHVDRWWENR